MRHDSQGRDFDLVTVGFKSAVRRSEVLTNSARQVETECLGYFGSEDTERSSRIGT